MESDGISLFERIGGEVRLRSLVSRFYEIMSSDPEARECFLTHAGRDLSESAEKLSLFLTGILGGPPLYEERYGHPRLRMRHFPFAISDREADQWLYCMTRALAVEGIPEEIQKDLLPYFRQVTLHLRNR